MTDYELALCAIDLNNEGVMQWKQNRCIESVEYFRSALKALQMTYIDNEWARKRAFLTGARDALANKKVDCGTAQACTKPSALIRVCHSDEWQAESRLAELNCSRTQLFCVYIEPQHSESFELCTAW